VCLSRSLAGLPQPPHVRSRIAVLLLSLVPSCACLGCLSRPTCGHASPFSSLVSCRPPGGLSCRAASAAPRAIAHRCSPLWSRGVLWPAPLPGCLSHPSGCHGVTPFRSRFLASAIRREPGPVRGRAALIQRDSAVTLCRQLCPVLPAPRPPRDCQISSRPILSATGQPASVVTQALPQRRPPVRRRSYLAPASNCTLLFSKFNVHDPPRPATAGGESAPDCDVK
jgi:hypothetical protein